MIYINITNLPRQRPLSKGRRQKEWQILVGQFDCIRHQRQQAKEKKKCSVNKNYVYYRRRLFLTRVIYVVILCYTCQKYPSTIVHSVPSSTVHNCNFTSIDLCIVSNSGMSSWTKILKFSSSSVLC